MLHGITGHAEAYARNLRSHGEHFSVRTIDFIGHGYSSKPKHPLETKQHIDQVVTWTQSVCRGHTSAANPSAAGQPRTRIAA